MARTGTVLYVSGEYHSDRVGSPRARTEETISEKSSDALAVEINSRVENGAFGLSFPLTCDDAPAEVVGCSARAFWKVAKAHLPDWPQSENELPPTLTVLDFLEFCFERVAGPIHTGYHSFFRHHHLTFDREKGQERFRRDVNLILARNGVAYELESNGEVKRNFATGAS